MDLLFVGHFSNEGVLKNKAASAAGDIVQKQIIKDSIEIFGKDKVRYYSMEPNSCWPRGPLFIKSKKINNGKFISYINLPIFKNIIYCMCILYVCFKYKPKRVIQYNSYIFENISILLSSVIYKMKTISIVQDVRIGGNFSILSKVQDYLSNKFVKYFDVVVPVSKELGDYLNVDVSKIIVFEGGVTDFGFSALEYDKYKNNFATYAGALEKHNGVDRLLNAWIEQKIPVDLHIFGKGALSDYIIEIAKVNKHIIYHGLKEQSEVLAYQSKSKYNFCFRYSDGIIQEYFFPSKFFNIAMCPGLLVFNDFHGVPDKFMSGYGCISDDFNNLKEVIELSDHDILEISSMRKKYILDEHSWKKLILRCCD